MVLIIAKDSEERRRALQSALHHEEAPRVSFGPEHFEAFLQEIETLPFLSKSKAIVLHEIDQLDKASLEKLAAYLKKPNGWISLYLTASALSAQSKVVKNSERVIRLKEEKPWEKEKRLVQWVMEEAAASGVAIAIGPAQALVKSVEPAYLTQELEKLICYVGEKREITLEAIHAVCTPIHHETLWQLGEAIFARQSSVAIRIGKTLLEEGMALFPLLAHVRTQFHTTLKIFSLYQHEGKAAVAQAFPYLKGALLDKKIAAANQYEKTRLEQGIVHLFETELKAKNSAIKPALLLEILLVKMTHDTFSTSQCARSC